jgi:hypothetical protein
MVRWLDYQRRAGQADAEDNVRLGGIGFVVSWETTKALVTGDTH